MRDLISRAAAIDALGERPMVWTDDDQYTLGERNQYDIDRLAIGTLPSAEVTLCHLGSPCEYQNADIELPSAQPEQWIPVSERLPKEGEQVLVTDDAGGLATIDVDCGYFDEEYGRFEWFHSQNVTAWMPLPEPWRGEE